MKHSHRMIQVPSNSQRTPYDISEPRVGRYIRLKKPGPDLLVLVPPGVDADSHHESLVRTIHASAPGRTRSRISDALLTVLLFIVIPGFLMLGLGFTSFGRTGMLYASASGVFLALLVAYTVAAAWPRYGVISRMFSVEYPEDPERMVKKIASTSGFRYLTERDLSGSAAMDTLRRGILRDPSSVPDEIWATLWVYSAADELMPAASAHLQSLAEQYEADVISVTSEEMGAEIRVTMEDLRAEKRPVDLSPNEDECEAGLPEPDLAAFQSGRTPAANDETDEPDLVRT